MAALINIYKQWVKAHPSLVAYMESGLSSITYLLPDRFADSEFSYEALNAAVGLAAVWHTSILKEDDPDSKQHASVLWLAALQQIETLVEIRGIHLEQLGKLNRYGPLVLLELCKALLRLRILHVQSARLLVNDSLQDDSMAEDKHEKAAAQRFQDIMTALERFRTRHQQPPPPTPTTPTRAACTSTPSTASQSPPRPHTPASSAPSPCSHTPLPSPAPPPPLPSLWWTQPPRAANPAPPPPAPAPAPAPPAAARPLPSPVRTQATLLLTLGELLHTHRPLIYVLLLKRYSRHSWIPWLSSLGTDLASAALLARSSALLHSLDALAHPRPTHLYSLSMLRHLTSHRWSLSEEREMARRKVQLALYLMRSPFFDRVTVRGLRRVQAGLHWLPLMGPVADKLLEILEGLQGYYTYTSGSR